jgi:hypothetical protein
MRQFAVPSPSIIQRKVDLMMIQPLRSLAFLLLLLLSPVLAAQKGAAALEVNHPIHRKLESSEKHRYQVYLKSGQFLRLTLLQDGIDVVLEVYDPNDKKLMEGDSPVGRYGVENLRLLADSTGNYRIEVRPLESQPSAGGYEIVVAELRSAKPQEKAYFARIEELKQLNILRFQAEAANDKAVLGRIYADELMITDVDNRPGTGERQAILSAARPMPIDPSIQPTYKIEDVKVHLVDDTAVIATRINSRVSMGEQSITAHLCYTDTYVKRAGIWQLIASHCSTITENKKEDYPEVKVSPKLLDEYVGVYEASPRMVSIISRQEDKLYIGSLAGSRHELVPESESTFFIQGSPTKYVFIRDDKGKISLLAMRVMGQELKARRVNQSQ